MSFGRKQFDSMNDFTDFDEKTESNMGQGSDNNSQENGLSWRRVLISRAAANVKKAFESKADLTLSYKKGALVFDEKANKYARVIESRPGFLNLSLLSGSQLVRQDLIPLEFVRDHRNSLTLPQMAKELMVTDKEIVALLNQIDSEKKSPVKELNLLKKPKKASKKPVLKAFVSPELAKNSNKPMVKIAAKNKNHSKKDKEAFNSMPTSPFFKLLPKGSTTDPVVDPNGYIQQNFLLMNNKELALATSLSEHTVRRKLGEWGLKRKNYFSRA